jgi:acetyl esterase/lipase
VGLSGTIDGQGYWVVNTQGVVSAYGDAHNYGSVKAAVLTSAVVGISGVADGNGYWVVQSNGKVVAFGDAAIYAAKTTVAISGAVGITGSADGAGYWVVQSNGKVVAFGDAQTFAKSGGALTVPAVAMASTPDGRGYWVVGRNGSIVAYGDAKFYGSTVGGARVVAIKGTSDGKGYWVAHSNGQIANFGDAVALVGGSGSVVGFDVARAPAALSGTYGGATNEGVLIYPAAVAGSPVVVLVHGGGFDGGSNRDPLVQSEARYLQLHGVSVFSINYTLSGPGLGAFPMQPQEVTAAVGWAVANAASYNGSATRISLVGGSAGGTLVGLSEALVEASGIHLVSVNDLSGPSDFGTYVSWIQGNSAAMAMLSGVISDALGCGNIAACTPAEEAAGSLVGSSVAPGVTWVVAGGTSDPLVPYSQVQEAAGAVTAGAKSVKLVPVASSDHAFELGWAVDSIILAAVKG